MATEENTIVEHVHCESADDFLAAIQLRGEYLWDKHHPNRWLFRGHASDGWALIPSALRPGAFRDFYGEADCRCDPQYLRVQIQTECHCIARFLQIADAIGLMIPDDSMQSREDVNDYFQGEYEKQNPETVWMPSKLFALAALAQHSGMPTRLLDWSASPYKAAYFAAGEAARSFRRGVTEIAGSDRLSVWAIDRQRFKHTSGKLGSSVDNYGVPVHLFSVPRASNPNAHAQDGWFSVVREHGDLAGGVPRDSLDKVLGHSILKPQGPLLKHFTLAIGEAQRLLWLLAVEQVSAAVVFRDFRGAADAAREAGLYPHADKR